MTANSLLDRATCPVCGGGRLSIIVNGSGSGLTSSDIGPNRKRVAVGQIIQCKSCHFAFQRHGGNNEALQSAYAESTDTGYDQEARSREKTAALRLRAVHRHIKRGRLLDVGCASGGFLSLAKAAGWEVVGIEPSPDHCVRAGEKLGGVGHIICGTIDDAPSSCGPFDAITLWDVLEHVQDPVAMIKKASSLLASGGFLFATMPDISSVQARMMGASWPLLLPEHLGYFTRRSLQVCGEQAGLVVDEFRRIWPRFSIGYLAFRLSQHRIPGSALLAAISHTLKLDDFCIPVPTGDLFCAMRNRQSLAEKNP